MIDEYRKGDYMSKKEFTNMQKLNLKSKEIIDELKSMNVEVSNHMQALEDDQIKALDKSSKRTKHRRQTKYSK